MVLDLTPNYLGNDAWFSSGDVPDVLEKLAVGQNNIHAHKSPGAITLKMECMSQNKN